MKVAPLKETNMQVWLFTKELGVVVATVQGVRKPTAKLRSHLIEYTLVAADLVKGRGVWRLVSASVLQNPFGKKYDALSARSYIRALSLVLRLCTEEGGEPELFEHLQEVLTQVVYPQANQKLFDAVILWKELVILGYIALDRENDHLFRAPLSTLEIVAPVDIKAIIKVVENAIKESHL